MLQRCVRATQTDVKVSFIMELLYCHNLDWQIDVKWYVWGFLLLTPLHRDPLLVCILLTCAPRRSIVLQCFWHVDTRPISPFLWHAHRAGLLWSNFFGQPGSVSKFPPFLWVKLWVGWVGRGYTEISRYFPASWINWVTLVTKIKLLYSLRF